MMEFGDIFISFLTSVLASGTHESISKHLTKSVDEQMQDSFGKAYGKWIHTDLYSRGDYSIDSYGELLQYIQHPESEIDPAVQELLGFWKEEIYLNPICKAALDDYQHTYMIATQNRLESESKASSRELSEEETHRQDDIKTLTMLMEAFSFRLMDEFSRDTPDFVHTLVVGSYDVWTEILEASDFYIHDEQLRIAISDMYSIWSEAILLGETWYFPVYGNSNRYKFEGLDDFNPKPGAEKAYHQLA
ncbi:MAG: hypothetical protein K2J58_07710, partial [Muribaculaceae bacterium]|nr:hypothetical protein [Muribaculaceae bacterium]